MKEKYDNETIVKYILKNECDRNSDLEHVNKILKLVPGIRLGINGNWGSGKTVFSHIINFLSSYDETNTTLIDICNKCDEIKNNTIIYFDASKEDIFDNPLMSLLKVISDKLTKRRDTEEQQNSDQNIFLEIAKIFDKTKDYEDEEFAKNYYNTSSLIDKIKKFFLQGEKYLLIIDELDRCNPKYVLKLLSTVKHFFDIEELSIIYMYNYDELWSIVKNEYGYSNEEYFQKFIDFEYKLNGIVGEEYAMPEKRNSLDSKINICSSLYQLNFREKNNLIFLIDIYNATHNRDRASMYMDVITICHCVIKKYDIKKLDNKFIDERIINLEGYYYSDYIEQIKMNILEEIKNNQNNYFIKKFKDLI